MSTPTLTLNGKPNPIDGELKLRVSYYDTANPLLDKSGNPQQSTIVDEYQYPEFTEYIDIPMGVPIDTALIDSLVTMAYNQAYPKAEANAIANDIKLALIPVLNEWTE